MYAYAAVAIAAAIAASAATWRIQEWRFDSERLAATENAREVERMRRQAANTGAAKHEADKAQIRTVFKTITQEVERIVEKPIYRDICLDDEGLSILRKSIDAANDLGELGLRP